MGHTGMKYSLASRELIADSIEVMSYAIPLMLWSGPQLRQDHPREC